MTSKYCPKCGAKLAPGAKFCAKCGHPVKQEETNVVKKEPEDTKSVASSTDSTQNKYEGVNGWLLLYTIGLVAGIGFSIFNFISYVALALKFDVNAEGASVVIGIYLILGFGFAILLAIQSIALVQIIRRKKSAKIFVVISLVYGFLLYLADAGIAGWAYELAKETAPSDLYGGAGRAFFALAIWLPYFLVSKRVKQTLVK